MSVCCRGGRSWKLLVWTEALWLWAHLKPPHLSYTRVRTHVWTNEALNRTTSSYAESGKQFLTEEVSFKGHSPLLRLWISAFLGEAAHIKATQPPVLESLQAFAKVSQSLSQPACSTGYHSLGALVFIKHLGCEKWQSLVLPTKTFCLCREGSFSKG